MKLDNKFLLSKTPEVSKIDKTLANDLMNFMKRKNALGLAANQVGLNCRLFVMNVNVPRRCFNPRIVEFLPNNINTSIKEGCLSYPNNYILKPRYLDIIVEYINQEGKLIEATLYGLEAICFQHELDHLNGIEWIKE
jgi:peptide deformylase